uniref:Uncharacterized protein n=1 Tax=Megaselia scalaris TaxID=36166 RepID=T1GVK6_MEGSC
MNFLHINWGYNILLTFPCGRCTRLLLKIGCLEPKSNIWLEEIWVVIAGFFGPGEQHLTVN